TTEIYTLSLHDALPIYYIYGGFGALRDVNRVFQIAFAFCVCSIRNNDHSVAAAEGSSHHLLFTNAVDRIIHFGSTLRLDLVNCLGQQVQTVGEILMKLDLRIEGGEQRAILTRFEHRFEKCKGRVLLELQLRLDAGRRVHQHSQIERKIALRLK